MDGYLKLTTKIKIRITRQGKQDQKREPYKGRIRFVCDRNTQDGIVEEFEKELPLAILGEPKPAQGRFYVAEDSKGTPQHNKSKKDAGYDASGTKNLRGRKQYWHHKDLPDGYWDLSVKGPINGRYQEYRRPGTKKDSQYRAIKGWIKPDTEFEASLYVQNLQDQEVGALLWLLSRPEGHYFRLGYGKPLGFGSVKIEIDEKRLIGNCLPLGTGEHWKQYYACLNGISSCRIG